MVQGVDDQHPVKVLIGKGQAFGVGLNGTGDAFELSLSEHRRGQGYGLRNHRVQREACPLSQRGREPRRIRVEFGILRLRGDHELVSENDI